MFNFPWDVASWVANRTDRETDGRSDRRTSYVCR